MAQKSELDLRRAQLLKAVRTMVRLKHAMAADEELNRVLPRIEEQFEKAIRTGKPFELAVHELLAEVDEV